MLILVNSCKQIQSQHSKVCRKEKASLMNAAMTYIKEAYVRNNALEAKLRSLSHQVRHCSCNCAHMCCTRSASCIELNSDLKQ